MGQTLIAIDKIDKEGSERVIEMLLESGLSQEQAEGCVDLASKSSQFQKD